VTAEGFYGADLAHVHDDGFGFWVRAATPFVLARLRAAGLDGGLVVELGCGSGISSSELLDAGWDVLGVDVSQDMLALAQERALAARFVHGSAHDVALPRRAAAVTAIGEVVNYDGPDSLESLFARVHEALAPGGQLLFDAAAPGREPNGRRSAAYDGDGWSVAIENVEDRERRTLTRRLAVERDGRRGEELHTLRLYEPADVLGWLDTAGFEQVERLDGYGDDAPRVPGLPVYVATRTKR
jgi:SAM-dependent methyltransferase